MGCPKSRISKLVRHITVFSVVCVSLCVGAFAVDATVNASALKIRSETNTECTVLDTVMNGTVLNVTGKMGDWYSVDYAGTTGFVFGEYVDFASGVVVADSMGTVTGGSVNVRTTPSLDGSVITKLLKGTNVKVLAVENGWYQISYTDYVGYMHPDYVLVNGVAYTNVTTEADSDIPDEEKIVSGNLEVPNNTTASTEQAKLIEYAKQFLGVKYVYGGASPDGFDCSGFTYYVFKQFGYDLNRSSAAQINNGTEVSMSELQPGDLVFFSRGNYSVGHVGIYIGDGNFIHSTSPGDVVSITPMNMKYYAERYVGARRIL